MKLFSLSLIALLCVAVPNGSGANDVHKVAEETVRRRILAQQEIIDITSNSRQSGRRSGSFKNNMCKKKSICQSVMRNSIINLEERRLRIKRRENREGLRLKTAQNCFTSSIFCSKSKFRSIDGSCNNLKHPYWGKSFTPFDRILPAEYEGNDGIRTGVNPRMISSKYHTHEPIRSTRLSLMVMQFGQFLDHDITHTPVSTIFSDGPYSVETDCCNSRIASLFPDCAAIKIMDDDVFDFDCMNFVRSAPSSTLEDGKCTFGAREQFNQITTFIDASNVYGSDETTLAKLRGSNGYLKVSNLHSKPHLPIDDDAEEDECGHTDCFLAGDERVNEQPDLTLLHTIFVREHNRIAKSLKNIFKNKKRRFYEARKLVAAEMQMIVYNEYLPAILGEDYVSNNPGLSLNTKTKYSKKVRPILFNEFSAAAFRFGHTQIPNMLSFGTSKSFQLRTQFFNTSLLHSFSDTVPELTSGLLDDKNMKVDHHITEEVTDHLFEENGIAFDLIALNIQRGRDHGIPSYKQYKLHYGQDPTSDISSDLLSALNDVYGNLDDIDLFVGGISEDNLPNAAVGPLFQKIFTDQFIRLRKGDRFFFDNGKHYSEVAVNEIKKVRLSHVLCRNAEISGSIREFSFLANDPAMVDCSSAAIQNGINVELPNFYKKKKSNKP